MVTGRAHQRRLPHPRLSGMAALLALLLAGTGPGLAQSQGQPAPVKPADTTPVRTETVTYENWIVTCRERVEKASKKVCAATLKVSDAQSKRDVLVWQLGQDAAGAPTVALGVPFGVRVKDGVTLTLENGKPRKVDYVTCERAGCEAAAPLDAAFAKELLAARQATIVFTLSNGQAVNLKVPLNGIEKVLPALKG